MTCRQFSQQAVFYTEGTDECKFFRDQALIDCGCGATLTDSPTYAPTKYPSRSPTEHPTSAPTQFPTNVPTVTPTQFPTSNPTQSNSDASTQLNTDGITEITTTIIQRQPDCQALMAGNYPDLSSLLSSSSPMVKSKVKTAVLDYNIDLTLIETIMFGDVANDFEDAASRIVSASAAGCNDMTRFLLLNQDEEMKVKKNLRKILSTDNKVHYVKFEGLTIRDGESCVPSSGGSTCIAAEGTIKVVYSSMPSEGPRIRSRVLEDNAWAEEMVEQIMYEKQASIIAQVPGIHSVDTTITDEQAGTTSEGTTTNGTALGVGIGCSVGALALGGFLIKRNGNLNKRKFRNDANIEYIPESDAAELANGATSPFRLSRKNSSYGKLSKEKLKKSRSSFQQDEDVNFPLRCLSSDDFDSMSNCTPYDEGIEVEFPQDGFSMHDSVIRESGRSIVYDTVRL